MPKTLYPAIRAVERAVAVPHVQPLRLFPVLWPLRRVDTVGKIHDENAYGFVDRFLVRALVEGRFASVTEISSFLSLPDGLVRRCVAFLEAIGHVTASADHVQLTRFGWDSWHEGVRLEPRESRQPLLFDAYSGRPLPRRYYDSKIEIVGGDEAVGYRTAGVRFWRLYPATVWRPQWLSDLEARPDRADFNVPARLTSIEGGAVADVYLPTYLIETARHGLLAYTALSDDRDEFVEGVCRDIDGAGQGIEPWAADDPREIWQKWLATNLPGPGRVRQLPSGIWRITLPAASFGPGGKKKIRDCGGYVLQDHHFAQLWCDDRDVRHAATRERALEMCASREVRDFDDLRRRIEPVVQALDVAMPSLTELRDHVRRSGRAHLLEKLGDTAAAQG